MSRRTPRVFGYTDSNDNSDDEDIKEVKNELKWNDEALDLKFNR